MAGDRTALRQSERNCVREGNPSTSVGGELTRTGEEESVERPGNRIRGGSEEPDEPEGTEGTERNRKGTEGTEGTDQNPAGRRRGRKEPDSNCTSGGWWAGEVRPPDRTRPPVLPIPRLFDEMRLVQSLPVLMVATFKALRESIAQPSSGSRIHSPVMLSGRTQSSNCSSVNRPSSSALWRRVVPFSWARLAILAALS